VGLLKFTPKRQAEFCDKLRKGVGRVAAAKAVRISPRTYQLLLHDDEQFREAVDDACAEASDEVESALWQAAVSGNTTAQQVWLYNRRPDQWTDKRNLQVTGIDEGPIQFQVNIGEIPDYELMLDDADPRAWMVGNGQTVELPGGDNGHEE